MLNKEKPREPRDIVRLDVMHGKILKAGLSSETFPPSVPVPATGFNNSVFAYISSRSTIVFSKANLYEKKHQ